MRPDERREIFDRAKMGHYVGGSIISAGDRRNNRIWRPSNSRSSESGKDQFVHRWYRIIMGFDGKLVKHLIDRLSINDLHTVLDPFCGSGTTLVECKKNGIPSIGIDANPACVFASQVKTNWHLRPESVASLMPTIIEKARSIMRTTKFASHPALRYLIESGMIRRGWISSRKAEKIIALMDAIDNVCASSAHRNFYCLALVSAMVRRIADIKFGPEVYCLSKPNGVRVVASFVSTALAMMDDLSVVRQEHQLHPRPCIILGDSRRCDQLLAAHRIPTVDFIITSPPYPNEHDYTRCTRLELVLLGYVRNKKQLRALKRTMLRCHTKGVYRDDDDASFAAEYEQVRDLASRLDDRARGRTDGFSRLYGKVIREYFGGMTLHLKAAVRSLKPNGMCAYVVSDQQSLLGVYVDTPSIIKEIATSPQVGFRVIEEITWRKTRGSTGQRTLKEKVLLFARARH